MYVLVAGALLAGLVAVFAEVAARVESFQGFMRMVAE
jgi:hypothetical protein